LSGPGFYPAFERFVIDWQDPATGFFGVTYITDENGNTIRTRDLSLTFHMVRYVPHLVRWWPKLIDTLLAIKTGIYPEGWLDGGTSMSDHNNYDVAELFYRGWIQMLPRQRQAATTSVDEIFTGASEDPLKKTAAWYARTRATRSPILFTTLPHSWTRSDISIKQNDSGLQAYRPATLPRSGLG
jgi:hypothetical protein